MSDNRKISRRAFGRVALSAVAAPYFVPSRALGGDGAVAASERLTLGFIGVGNMGGGHVQTFAGNRDVQIVAICDVNRDRREKMKAVVEEQYSAAGEKFSGVDLYNEFEELLARPDIDAVVVATPDHWHALVATAACRAGKDVYCEKPLSLTIREAREMARTARRYQRVFQTGSQQRSDSNFRYACELVRNGRIGKLLTVHVGVGNPSTEKQFVEQPVPEGFDWNRWLGPAPWQPYNAERCSGSYSGGWRLVRDYSGGMMTDWGAHHFDIAQWGMGMDDSGPIEIIPPDLTKPTSTDAASPNTLTYKYASGVTMFHGGANGILFTGTEGKVEVNRGYFKTWPDEIGKQPIGPSDVNLYRSPGHHQDWLDCIRTRKRPICDVEIGCRTITVCHLGNIAYWTGRPLHWDPVAEELLNDDAAARWLDRPKRGPWRLNA